MTSSSSDPAHEPLIGVCTTVGNVDDARRIARELVDRGLAACAQITAIDSVYRWQGALHEEPEWRLLFKTTKTRYAEVEAALLERHPYDLPAIYAVPVEAANAAYAAWVADGSAGPGA